MSYDVVSETTSYFALDNDGHLANSDGLPVAGDGVYSISTSIHPQRTAIIVMDPWVDMACDFLNHYFEKITKSTIVPLVHRAYETGHQIIIFTNDPSKTHFNTQIDHELLSMVDGIHIHLLYHQNYNSSTFAGYLKKSRINTLIYTGFASNMCILGRQTGMVQMKQHGVRLFFVPEASAAIETPDSWENGAIHRATTTIISQWIGKLIHYRDLMDSMSLD